MKNSILSVDLNQLEENYKELYKEVSASTTVVPVLKGNAYGFGIKEVSQTLESTGLVKYFSVSHVSEGIELRNYTKKPIWILSSPLSSQIEMAISHDLTLTVGRLEIVRFIDATAKYLGKRANIQLKIETGLNRIGLTPGNEINQFFDEYQKCTNVNLVGAFSHFASCNPDIMDKQYIEYRKGLNQLDSFGINNIIKHIACSATIEATNMYDLDAVRIGRRLYMDNPYNPSGKIKEICEYKSFLTSVHERKKGETLGYDGKYILERDCVVGTIGIGYGDGYLSELFNAHAPVLINGIKCPLLTTCMDQSFVLLENVEAKPDDEVIFFNKELTSQEVAQTIGEEGCTIIDNLNQRVEKIYF